MKNALLKMYHNLKESGSTSTWPILLGNVLYKVLLDKFKGVNSPWRQYTAQGNLADFKTATRIMTSEAPDLLEIAEDAPYQDSTFSEYSYNISLKTWGRTFTVGRKAIINDDLDAIKKQPQRFGRSAARTLVKRIVTGLEADGVTFDGKSLFHNDHNNKIATALTNDAAGIAALSQAMTNLEKATDLDTGEKMGLSAKYLLVPPDLEDTAMRIINGTMFTPVSTSGGTEQVGKVKRLTPLMEPFLTSTSKVYVMADPQDAPVIEVGFLNGKETPDLLIKRADTVNVAGGEDEFGYDFDEIFYKVRFDYDIARAMYQGVVRMG